MDYKERHYLYIYICRVGEGGLRGDVMTSKKWTPACVCFA